MFFAGGNRRTNISGSQIPTRPDRFAQMVAVINGFNRALNKEVGVVVGVSGGV
jgi:hypothetical protein